MAPMRNILLAVTLACFFGGGLTATDQVLPRTENHAMAEIRKDIQDLSDTVNAQAVLIKQQALLIDHQTLVISEQATVIQQLQETDRTITNRVEKLESVAEPQQELVQNFTLEERVELLEIQVVVIQDEVSDLETNVNFLFDEQVIQDERLLNLEEASDSLNEEVEDLQVTTLELDFRVTTLEENGGSDGNSSISELEERVETLEGTAADHETRITDTEGDVEDLAGTSDDLETRLTAAEENIQGLQMTDISLDARITALEENGGGGSQNDTIAFHAVLSSYSTIPDESTVEFNEILLNEGNGYDSTTGIFTVPPGGEGLYYFSTYLMVDDGEVAHFDIRLNDDVICSAYGDDNASGSGDWAQATCSAVASVEEGDEVKLMLKYSNDNTPLYVQLPYYFDGFNGFRI